MTQKSSLEVNASMTEALGSELSLSDLEAVRLILNGRSIIDWNRANFRSIEEADRFLRLHLFNVSNRVDLRRLRFLKDSAIAYLEEQFNLSFPDDIKYIQDVRSLLLIASQTGGFRRRQILSCVILKLMHVLQHLDAAELRYQISISEADLLDMMAKKIDAAGKKLKESGLPVLSFYGSRKARNSIITKLLAKQENVAATVFDKLRYRIVTQKPEDVLSTVIWLSHHLFAFNYVIPRQSHNNLIAFSEMMEKGGFLSLKDQLQSNGIVEEESLHAERNSFSASTYRTINFIVDIPLRIDHLVNSAISHRLGSIVYMMVEFQILDQQTALTNEEGANAHSLYKQRQLAQVGFRLRKGGKKRLKS